MADSPDQTSKPVRTPPVASIVLVSDYETGEEASWEDARATLQGLAAQDFDEPVEYLLVERQDIVVPEGILHALAGLRLIRTDQHTSFAMKNEGVRRAQSDLVVLLDLDCVPAAGWLRAFVTAMRLHPSAVAVSGRTVHAGRSLTEKIVGLIARGYLDPGGPGPTRYVANHNGGYRRAAYLAHPLPGDTTPFTSTLQSEEIRRAGGELWFEPAMRAVHQYSGWTSARDICINAGYGTVRCRLRDPLMPYAGLTRLGVAAIPLFVGAKIIDAWMTCLRCARSYDVPWLALPYALALAVLMRIAEAPGMLRAFRGQALHTTAFR
ncbi:MAG: hypothetical protein H6Q33_1702 [Deltaproteobacteria bacterium]|nr:hypothetical protein [Deltaproteobacteria bacterium]